MKRLRFLGNSLTTIRDFPSDVRQDLGFQLEQVQKGKNARDFKPMPAIGPGVEELRIWDSSGTYRVIYTARLRDVVYVLHAFQKKTQATSKPDMAIARTRLRELIGGN
jgi:phage-related protein